MYLHFWKLKEGEVFFTFSGAAKKTFFQFLLAANYMCDNYTWTATGSLRLFWPQTAFVEKRSSFKYRLAFVFQTLHFMLFFITSINECFFNYRKIYNKGL